MATAIIVDDAGFIRKVLSSVLTELGHEVIAEATSGEEAIEIFKTHQPDLIFMDMVLPGKNGADTSLEVIKAWPEAKIIAMSSVQEDWIRAKALAAGCVDFIAKPFSKDTIRKVINTHFELRKGAHG